jgi:diguanylate cyclase (GGDEF)-like protein
MKTGDTAKASAPGIMKTSKGPRGAGARGAKRSPPGSSCDSLHILGVPEVELTARVREALIGLLSKVEELRAELSESKMRLGALEALADRDPLLDVLNRRAFMRELERALSLIHRYQDMSASLIFMDLNDLKKINDSMGHSAGDAALMHVARSLEAKIRPADCVGRLGGDEFGVLLIKADRAAAARKAEELAAFVSEEPVKWKDRAFLACVSWGVVEIQRGASALEAIESADHAMYAAKRKL